jgi:hypothetical protein
VLSSAPAAKDTDARVTVFCEIDDVTVNQMETAGKSTELDTIELEIIACLQTPVNQIALGRMERSMEYGNYVLGNACSLVDVFHDLVNGCGLLLGQHATCG